MRQCLNCGSKKTNLDSHKNELWLKHKGGYVCKSCYAKLRKKIRNNKLSKHTTTGKGLIGEQIVAKYLNIENENIKNDMFSQNSIDLLHEKHGKINVKTCALYIIKNFKCQDNNIISYIGWRFNTKDKAKINTYFLLGFDEDRKNIIHVWIVSSIYIKISNICILNSDFSLKIHKKYEVDVKPFNDILHELSKKNCPYLCDVNIKNKDDNNDDFRIITGR